jgi:hypothetical protein
MMVHCLSKLFVIMCAYRTYLSDEMQICSMFSVVVGQQGERPFLRLLLYSAVE